MKQVVEMEFGSYVYGTNVATSDRDYKGVFIPEYRDIILQKPAKVINENTNKTNTKNESTDVDMERHALHHFLKLLCEGQTMCFDMLFCPRNHWIDHGSIWLELQRNTDKLVSSKISAFAGYCQAQAAKYSLKGSNLAAYKAVADFFRERADHVKLFALKDEIEEILLKNAVNDMKYSDKNEPLIQIVNIPHKVTKVDEPYLQVGPKTKVPLNAKAKLAVEIMDHQIRQYGDRAKLAEKNQGVDWKALMHAVRVCKEAQELLMTGQITFPRPEKHLLLQIRKGELDYNYVAEMIVRGLDELKVAQEKTTLRDKPDYQWIEDFVFSEYSIPF